MDHLPLPEGCRSHTIIPNLGGPEWDGEAFQDFPRRCGWDLAAIRRGEKSENKLWLSSRTTTTCGIDQCIQTWMFFGTLSLAFRRRIARADYTREAGMEDGSQCSVLCTHSWLSDLRPDRLSSALNSSDTKNQQILQDALDLSALTLLALTQTGSDVISEKVHLHLAVHIYYLHYLFKITALPPGATGSVFACSHRLFDFESILKAKGWCPSLLPRLSGIGTLGLYYCGLMPKPPDAGSGRSHEHCSNSACTVLNLDETTYETRHVKGDCTCAFVEVPTSALVDCIRRNQNPVIEVHANDASGVVSLVIRSTADVDGYIAISHVWSDGLGNLKANAIPTCQLLRISELVRNIDNLDSSSSLNARYTIWMDTLCVPMGGEDLRRWRTEAIRSMARIYQKARAVLVLDQTLTRVSAATLSLEEKLLRIVASNWMTRLWTLQEGALAANLLFQFRDSVFDFNTLRHEAEAADVFTAASFLARRVVASHRDVFSLRGNIVRYKYPLAAVWNSLNGRTTSRLDDAPICLGNLIGLDVGPLFRSENIMEEFWKMQRESIPSSILWVSGRKLLGDGFKWAPATLLQAHSESTRLSDDCSPATWHPIFGLTVTGIPAYILKYAWTPVLPKASTLREADLAFEFTIPETQQRLKVYLNSASGSDKWSNIKLHALQDAILLLREPVTTENQADGILAAPLRRPEPHAPTRLSWRAQVRVRESSGHYERVKGYPGVAASFRAYSDRISKQVTNPETGQVRDAEGEIVDNDHVWTIR